METAGVAQPDELTIDAVLMTQSEFARHRNVSRQAVSKWVEAEKIAVNADGLIDAAAADLALGETVERINEPRDQEESGAAKLTDARIRETLIRGRLAELELKKKLGEVVPVSGVANAAASCGEVVVRTVRGLSNRVDGFLGNAKDAASMRAFVKSVERDLLSQISEAFAKMAVEATQKSEAPDERVADAAPPSQAALFAAAD